jgi:hypothetical protein
MQTHSYSIVLRDVSWSDIGSALDAVQKLDSDDNIDLQARHDTSGGTLEDGTVYQTETVFTAKYSYPLSVKGQTAIDDFAAKLSQVPAFPDDTTQLAETIQQRR